MEYNTLIWIFGGMVVLGVIGKICLWIYMILDEQKPQYKIPDRNGRIYSKETLECIKKQIREKYLNSLYEDIPEELIQHLDKLKPKSCNNEYIFDFKFINEKYISINLDNIYNRNQYNYTETFNYSCYMININIPSYDSCLFKVLPVMRVKDKNSDEIYVIYDKNQISFAPSKEVIDNIPLGELEHPSTIQ